MDSEKNWNELLVRYCELKQEEQAIKKELGTLGSMLKEKMIADGINVMSTEKCRVVLTKRERSELDDLRAVEILRDVLPEDLASACIDTKEVVNDDFFEELVYRGVVDAAVLLPAMVEKPPVYALIVKQGGK